jgi:glycosyltransferase involved in cell wall biosynthesis
MLLFSIIIPVYNRESDLKNALESVLSQSMQNFEVLIVDDGSDPTIAVKIKQVVDGFEDKRLKLFRHKLNKNGAAARNKGIHAASGKYVCFLDSDDYWLPNKLELVINCIKKQNGGDDFLIHHQYSNSKNGTLAEALPKTAKGSSESVAHYSFVTNNVGGIQSSTICVPVKLARRCLFDERFSGHQDWDFALQVGALTQNFYFIPAPLTIRSKDSDNSVADNLSWRYSLWFYTQRVSYFDNYSALSFFQRVVLRKAVFSLEFIPAITNKLLLRVLLTKPFATIKILILFSTLISQQQKRIRQVELTCQNRNVKTVIIWGANDYAKSLILNFKKSLKVLRIIDSKVMNSHIKLQGIEVTPLKSISRDELDQVDALILATDKHQESMKNDIFDIAPILLEKVIEF